MSLEQVELRVARPKGVTKARYPLIELLREDARFRVVWYVLGGFRV